MPWYRIDDRTAGQTVLIEAFDSDQALEYYLGEYPPDLDVSPVPQKTVDQWPCHPSDPIPL